MSQFENNSSSLHKLNLLDPHWQVVVIGAGPAGSVCAFRLAREGKKVLLVDKANFPRSKVCGSCISAQTLSSLREAGLNTIIDEHMQAVEAPTISQIQLCTARGATRLSLALGRALSRQSLDFALIKEAQSAGVVFLDDISAFVQEEKEGERESTNTSNGPRRVTLQAVGASNISAASESITIETDCIVVADGINGQSLAQLSGSEGKSFNPIIAASSRIGAGTVVDCTGASDEGFYKPGTIYMALHQHGYVGVVMLEQNKVDLGAAFDRDFTRLCGSPKGAARKILEASGMPFIEAFDQGHWFGTAPFTRHRQTVASRRLFIIGDAASYGEPFTGEGIGWALNSALLVVPYVLAATSKWEDSRISAWQKKHAGTIKAGQITSLQIGSLLRHKQISTLLIEKILKNFPSLSQKFLAISTNIRSST